MYSMTFFAHIIKFFWLLPTRVSFVWVLSYITYLLEIRNLIIHNPRDCVQLSRVSATHIIETLNVTLKTMSLNQKSRWSNLKQIKTFTSPIAPKISMLQLCYEKIFHVGALPKWKAPQSKLSPLRDVGWSNIISRGKFQNTYVSSIRNICYVE